MIAWSNRSGSLKRLMYKADTTGVFSSRQMHLKNENKNYYTLARTTNFFGGIGRASCRYSQTKSALDLLRKWP